MKILDNAPRQTKPIFLKREQIELAMKHFKDNIDPEQDGWYRFNEYATELQKTMMELRDAFDVGTKEESEDEDDDL